ncbi:AAA family ATPase [Zoogloea sp.]|uniref:AAA family ATPase n=1 Tax=Zoogloea sp. TaxID=49181 RepID=UPI0035B42D6D
MLTIKKAPRKPRPSRRVPWRTDFREIPAEQRRAGRYALQLVASRPALLSRLQDADFLSALWVLCLPLIEPAVLGQLQAEWRSKRSVRADEDGDDDWEDDLPDFLSTPSRRELRGQPGRHIRAYLAELLAEVPDALLERLAEQDGTAPTHPGVAVIAASTALDPVETALLDFVEKRVQTPAFSDFLRESQSCGSRDNFACVAAALGLEPAAIKNALGRAGTLRKLQLLRVNARDRTDLEDFLAPAELLGEILVLAPESEAALFELIVEPAPASRWTPADFPHLEKEAARLCSVLGRAAADGAVGVNGLLYGAPGTGKTEFAQAIATAAGLKAFRVKTADEEGAGLSREGRLGAYLLLQRVLRGRRDCLVIFDEVEDAFGGGINALLALFGGRSGASDSDKGWMNRILEDNPLPALWITNDAESMDPAFLRRFLLPVAFTTPPKSVRRRMAESHLGDTGLPSLLLDELAADEALLPAQLGAARRLLDLQPDVDPVEAVRSGVAASRRLLQGSPVAQRRQSATAFDAAYLNLAGGIAPGRIVQALERNGHGRLCFYGPPGTGKTEFAHVLADALGRELIVRSSSDLVSKYVGETERNLAALFRDIDAERSVLFLDEVDSFLRDRRQARQSWETTQVNELLQQIERFPGIFIAATNLMDGLDAAALRRFDFKLHFRPLTAAQRLSLFAREVFGDAAQTDAIPHLLARKLQSLELLTPGDFANVVRQRNLLGEELSAEDFLRRLAGECRWKERSGAVAA